jgi:hypothetical protein
MHFSKIKISFILFILLGFAYFALSSSTTNTVKAYEYLVNYNNNYNFYTSPDSVEKESAIKNIDCVVNFMQSYVYTSSSADTCNKAIPNNDNNNRYQTFQSKNPNPTPDSTQQTFQQNSDIGIVKVVDLNSVNSISNYPATYTYSSYSTSTTYTQEDKGKNNDNDKSKNNGNNDKVYNENTVTKEERKILLKACFERAEDKGNYISSNEIKKCAENYNS